MRRLLPLLPLSALAALALAACGSSGEDSTVPSLSGGTHTQASAAPGSLAAARAAVAAPATMECRASPTRCSAPTAR